MEGSYGYLEHIRTWGIFIVSIFGLFGNALCILVSLHRDMRSPVIVLIIGLALADSSVLVTLNITSGAGELFGYKQTWCRIRDVLIRMLVGFSFSCSIYFILIITVERYLIVEIGRAHV